MEDTKETKECCPVFDPSPWDCKTHEWNEKLFIRDYLPAISAYTFTFNHG